MLAALAVMLLAVVPHATFAASMRHASMRAASPPQATAMPAQAHAMAQEAAKPCHEATKTPVSSAQPPCCILGCGALGLAPSLATPDVTTVGHRLTPPRLRLGDGGRIEPAERPPRLG